MLLVMSELLLNVQNSCASLSLESLCGAKTLWYLRATQEPSSDQPSPFTEVQVKKKQLEPDREQWTGSKLGKEYVKAVYCYPAYLTCMPSTS